MAYQAEQQTMQLVYTFDIDFNVLDKRYIGDPATIAAKIDAVANQGKAHK